jgi:O-antigen/teichoic acid export membrane protein
LGQYSFLVTLFVLAENLKSCGLTSFLTREVARQGSPALVYYPSLVRFGLVGALAMAAVLVAVTAAASHSAEMVQAALVISAGLFPSAFCLAGDALFLALQKSQYSMYITVGENVLRLMVSLAVVLAGFRGVLPLAVVYAATRGLAAFVQQRVIRRHSEIVIPAYSPEAMRNLVRHAPSFLVVFVAPLLLFKMDVVLLGSLAGDYQLGLYSAAMRLIAVYLIVPDGIMTATFVLLSKYAGAGAWPEFRRLAARTAHYLSLGLLPVTLGTCFLAPWLLRLLFGRKFDSAIPMLQILAFALTPYAMCRALGDTLIARQKQTRLAVVIVTSIALSSVAYVVSIRLYGAQGASWAFLISTMIVVILTAREILVSQTLPLHSVLSALLPNLLCLLVFVYGERWAPPAWARLATCATGALALGFAELQQRLSGPRAGLTLLGDPGLPKAGAL